MILLGISGPGLIEKIEIILFLNQKAQNYFIMFHIYLFLKEIFKISIKFQRVLIAVELRMLQ